MWKQQLPFCLYLRSYDFTTRVIGTAAPTVEPPFGEMIAVNPVHDLQLRHLVKTTLPGIPVIAVVNPLDPPAEAGDFRYHDSEWRVRVGELVRAAQLIVMYLRGEDAGVAEEMQMIRDARRGDRTIVIVGNKDVFSFAGHIGGIAAADANWERKRTTKDAVAPVNVDGFPHVLAQEMPGFDLAVATLATQLVKEPAPREFSATAPLPHVPLLTAAERDAVIQSGIVAVNVARHWLAQNSVLRAEASFDEAWARFFAVDATRHRASVALEMGTLYLMRANEPGNAAKRFQEASRLYRRLDVPTMLLTASQQLASALLRYRSTGARRGARRTRRGRAPAAVESRRVDGGHDRARARVARAPLRKRGGSARRPCARRSRLRRLSRRRQCAAEARRAHDRADPR